MQGRTRQGQGFEYRKVSTVRRRSKREKAGWAVTGSQATLTKEDGFYPLCYAPLF